MSEEVFIDRGSQGNNQNDNQGENRNGDQNNQGKNQEDHQNENPFNMFMDFLKQHVNPNQNQQPPLYAIASSFMAFESLRPPEFKGKTDPVEEIAC